MKKELFKTMIRVFVIVIWVLTCYPVCNKAEGFDFFLFWIMVGFPFGVHKMCLWLVPRNYGISGSIGIFALNCIIGGLIGGVVVIYRLIMAVVTVIRCILVGFGQIVLKSV